MSAGRFLAGLGVFALVGLAACFAMVRAKPQAAATAVSASKPTPATKPSTTRSDDSRRPVPAPELTPAQVVRVVMDALKNNDERDSGIAVTFDFASPQNKQMTGPLERFIPMVKSPVYRPMLNHRSAKVGTVLIRDDQAQAVIELVDENGESAAYLFRLSMQPDDGDPPNCWMTDGVIRVEPGHVPEGPKLNDVFGEDEAEPV